MSVRRRCVAAALLTAARLATTAALLTALALPGAVHAQAAPGEPVDDAWTGLVGRVVLATRCPVPVGDDDGGVCPAPGFPATLTVRSADGSTEVARVATDDTGEFAIGLDPGAYLVDAPAAAAGPPRVQTLAVSVAPDGPNELTIRVSAGFRRLP